MKKSFEKKVIIAIALISILALSACTSEVDKSSKESAFSEINLIGQLKSEIEKSYTFTGERNSYSNFISEDKIISGEEHLVTVSFLEPEDSEAIGLTYTCMNIVDAEGQRVNVELVKYLEYIEGVYGILNGMGELVVLDESDILEDEAMNIMPISKFLEKGDEAVSGYYCSDFLIDDITAEIFIVYSNEGGEVNPVTVITFTNEEKLN